VRTPQAFNAAFERRGIDAVCVAIQVPTARFDAALAGLKALPNLDGFIVTAPHKAAVMRYCDEIGEDGRLVGAVNTIRRLPDGRYAGTMLDGHGFVTGLRKQGHEPRGKRIFIAGAGGASSAISVALARAGAAEITLHNRTRARAEALAARLAAAFPACRVAVGTSDPSGHDIAINATPLGLEPGDPFSFDVARLTPDMLVAEVLMKPETTALLVTARDRGCRIHQGRHMLEQQLDLMFEFLKIGAGAEKTGREQ
jgi:shikimate dehydrogenase